MSYGSGGNFSPDSPQGGQRSYPQSYNDPSVSQRPPQPASGNRTLFWILGIVAFVAIGGALLCCGFGYFGFQFFTNELARQIQPRLQKSPEIVEHIGEIQALTLNLQATQQAGGAGAMIFDIQGNEGSGQISVDVAQLEDVDPQGYELILPDGRRIPLTGLGPTQGPFDPQAPAAVQELPRDDAPTPPTEPDAPSESDPVDETDAPLQGDAAA